MLFLVRDRRPKGILRLHILNGANFDCWGKGTFYLFFFFFSLVVYFSNLPNSYFNIMFQYVLLILHQRTDSSLMTQTDTVGLYNQGVMLLLVSCPESVGVHILYHILYWVSMPELH